MLPGELLECMPRQWFCLTFQRQISFWAKKIVSFSVIGRWPDNLRWGKKMKKLTAASLWELKLALQERSLRVKNGHTGLMFTAWVVSSKKSSEAVFSKNLNLSPNSCNNSSVERSWKNHKTDPKWMKSSTNYIP